MGFCERNVKPRMARASSSESGIAPFPLALADAREIHDLERGERGLLRLEERGESIDALVRHAGHAGMHLAARGSEGRGGDGGAREKVEQRGLPALGEADEPDLHRGLMLP